MKHFILSLTLAALVSCNVNPTKVTIRPDGTREYVTLGASGWTKSKTDKAVAYNPDGTPLLAYERTGNNQTNVITSSVGGIVAASAFQAYSDSKASVDNAKTAADLAKAKDATAATLEKAKIAADLEKAAMAAKEAEAARQAAAAVKK